MGVPMTRLSKYGEIEDNRTCSKCGHYIDLAWLFCPPCGNTVRLSSSGDNTPLRLSTATEEFNSLDELSAFMGNRGPIWIDEFGVIYNEQESNAETNIQPNEPSPPTKREPECHVRSRSKNTRRPIVLHQVTFYLDPFLPITAVIFPSNNLHSYVTRAKQHGFRSVTPPALIDWLLLEGWLDVWDCHKSDGRRLCLFSSVQDGKSLSIPVFCFKRKVSSELAKDVFGLLFQMSGAYWDEVIALYSDDNREQVAFFQYDWWSSGTALEIRVEVDA